MNIWEIFIQILPVFITTAFGFILYGAKIYLNKYVEHMDTHQKENLLNTINSIGLDAIFYSEQLAKNIKKNQMTDLKSADKLSNAVEYALEELKKQGITTMTPLEIERKIEVILGSGTFETQKMLQDMQKQMKVEIDNSPDSE